MLLTFINYKLYSKLTRLGSMVYVMAWKKKRYILVCDAWAIEILFLLFEWTFSDINLLSVLLCYSLLFQNILWVPISMTFIIGQLIYFLTGFYDSWDIRRLSIFDIFLWWHNSDLTTKKCVPCNSKHIQLMAEQNANELLKQVSSYHVDMFTPLRFSMHVSESCIHQGARLEIAKWWR